MMLYGLLEIARGEQIRHFGVVESGKLGGFSSETKRPDLHQGAFLFQDGQPETLY